jgi:spermidine synthase
MPPTARPDRAKARARLLLFSVLVVATCGLVYELISATMASYLLGDSITQFSLVIGVYLSAMGLGSWLSKYIERDLERWFIHVQLVVAIVGGFSATALFFGFAWMSSVRPLLFGLLVIVGTMVGLEIPLLMRLMPKSDALKDVVARVLAFDYLGALLASIVFPLLLLPQLGLVRTALLFGLFNALVATWTARAFGDDLRAPRRTLAACFAVTGILAAGLVSGARIESFGERQLFDAPVVISEKTPYQRLTITRWRDDVRLFIDGNLQFSSADEHRYHEALVHPAVAAAERPRRALILGGGDGMAARELLRYDELEHVDLVDLDPAMTRLFREHPMLAALNGESLSDPRLTVHNADAMSWLEALVDEDRAPYDVVIVDLPDPNNFSLGKLYSRSFYRLLRAAIAPNGAGVVQSTSPYFAPRAFWCVVSTLEAAGLSVAPFHAHVPSFGDWGFALISHRRMAIPELRPDVKLRYLNSDLVPTLFAFPADQPRMDVEINRLNDQLLVHYYEQDLGGVPNGGVR